eukprot:657818-Amorphochlora_amoeboformis.AAC.1
MSRRSSVTRLNHIPPYLTLSSPIKPKYGSLSYFGRWSKGCECCGMQPLGIQLATQSKTTSQYRQQVKCYIMPFTLHNSLHDPSPAGLDTTVIHNNTVTSIHLQVVRVLKEIDILGAETNATVTRIIADVNAKAR